MAREQAAAASTPDLVLGDLLNSRAQPHVDGNALLVATQLLEGCLLQVAVEGHQHLIRRLQQHHARIALQVLIQARHVLCHKVAQLAAELHACRPRANDHKRELVDALLLGQAGQVCLLEGVAQLLTELDGVVELAGSGEN